MNLEKQVCSLELAKKLKELGVKQQSLVYWLNIQHCVHTKVKKNEYGMDEAELDENGNVIIEKIDYRIELGSAYAWDIKEKDTWSAFTVAELGEILPTKIIIKGKDFFISMDCEKQVFYQEFHCNEDELYPPDINDNDNEANARAKMLIHLIENKLMESPK